MTRCLTGQSTGMTRDECAAQLLRLAVLKFPPETIEDHWTALHDLPIHVFTEAVNHALRTRGYFPVPAELRADADHVAAQTRPAGEPLEERTVPLAQPFTIAVPQAGTVVSITREWKYYDDRCSDTGWVSHWCGEVGPSRAPWSEVRRCGCRGDHLAHEWVERCPCYDTNPALVRRRERAKKYAEPPQRIAR